MLNLIKGGIHFNLSSDSYSNIADTIQANMITIQFIKIVYHDYSSSF
jgi:hypothetical protein